MNVCRGRLLKKSSNLQIEACPVNACHYMAFKHHISFATADLASNFGWDRFRITPDIVWKLLLAAIWSRWAVLFESEQTPFPRTGRRFRPAALHRIRLGTCCCSYVVFLLRDQWLIERLSEARGVALVGNNFSPIPSKFSFHMKKNVSRSGPKFTKH